VYTDTPYKDGFYDLHLPGPVEGGVYTCRIPRQHLQALGIHGSRSSSGQASIVVNQAEAWMMLMEADVRALRQSKRQLQEELKERALATEKTILQKVDALKADVDDYVSALESSLTQQAEALRTPLVAFNVQLTETTVLTAPEHVKFDNVLYNTGDGYDKTMGDFTAPLTGAYSFSFCTQGGNRDGAWSHIIANGQPVCTVLINQGYEQRSCQAVVYLQAGDKVWVEPTGGNKRKFWEVGAWFSGFLFNANPQP
jgi:hypothetical protein